MNTHSYKCRRDARPRKVYISNGIISPQGEFRRDISIKHTLLCYLNWHLYAKDILFVHLIVRRWSLVIGNILLCTSIFSDHFTQKPVVRSIERATLSISEHCLTEDTQETLKLSSYHTTYWKLRTVDWKLEFDQSDNLNQIILINFILIGWIFASLNLQAVKAQTQC